MAEPAGVEIPKGSPDNLRAAATAWMVLGRALDMHANGLDGAAMAVVGADWSGDASIAYSAKSGSVAFGLKMGATACESIAAACRQFSRALRDAQDRARDAKHRAEDAIGRRDAARREIDDAEQRIAAADTAAENAAHRAAGAAAAGPPGAHSLAAAQADGRHAASAKSAAETDLRRARDHLHDAERDLRRARKDGEDATEDAERAGRSAAHAFSSAASGVQPAPLIGVPVPVSLRGASPDVAGINPSFGGPFHGPGRFGSPGDARAAQIARQRAARRDAEETNEGGALDRFAGEFEGLTGLRPPFGIGDPDSEGYQDGKDLGNAVSYFPSPASLGKLGVKQGIKQAKEKARAPMKPINPVISNPSLRRPKRPEHPEVDLPKPAKPDLPPPPKLTARRNPKTGEYEIRPAKPPEPTKTGKGSARDDVQKADHPNQKSDKRGRGILDSTKAILGTADKLHDIYNPPHGPLG